MKMAVASRREQREPSSEEDESSGDLRRGPWTVEEDLLLVNYIAAHGEGRWNALARCAGLKRTGKSCRLRWLNYLRPDLRRGNITAREQLLILELHARWGNRWSKIAAHLPGRTDNEIKNYWRTRVQKHARQLNCDVNSQQFKDLVRYLWVPRLLERVVASGDAADDGGTTRLAAAEQQLSSCCTTAAASSSSVSTDGVQQQPPLVSPPPVLLANDAACCWSSSACTDNNVNTTTSRSMSSSACDTWCQPPHTHQQFETCGSSSWPELPGVGVDVAAALPELGDTTAMWGADDLWYTQMLMGL